MTTSTLPRASTKKWFTAAEFAEEAGVNVETVYRWARTGKVGFCPMLPGQRTYRFLRHHIDDFFNGIPPEPVAPKVQKPKRNPKYAGQ